MRVEEPPYRKILEVIWKVQKDEPESQVEYGKLKTALRYEARIQMMEEELRSVCRSIMGMAGSSYIFAYDSKVELSQKPEKVLEAIRSVDERQSGYAKDKT